MLNKLAPCLSLKDCPPHRLISLCDMLRATADLFAAVAHNIGRLQAALARARYSSSVVDDDVANLIGRTIEPMSKTILKLSTIVSIPATVAAANRLASFDAKVTDLGKFSDRVADIESRLIDELSAIKIAIITRHIDKLESPPSEDYDVREAAWCLVFERSTACVLHLMRALERPLSRMASDLLVDASKPNWNAILNDIEAQVRWRKDDKTPRPKRLPDLPDDFWSTRDRDLYTKATTHFFFIKNAWRNYAAHGNDKYTMEEAEEIYANVTGFMKHLSRHFSDEAGPDDACSPS